MKYRIYIDEVGNPDIDSSDDPNHRFLSLTGVIAELGYTEKVIHPQMEALKTKYFHSHPDDPVIFHRKEMVNAKPPFESLQTQQTREQFDCELLGLLSSWDYTVITVCLDKRKHKEIYTTWRYDPYHYCLAVLLERFALFLRRKDARGDVIAESRGGKEDKRLKDSFSRLWQNGTEYINADIFRQALTSKELKVKPKANNISGLQLADILAHPSRTDILCANKLWEKELAPFAKAVAEILDQKYDQEGSRVFGKKFL